MSHEQQIDHEKELKRKEAQAQIIEAFNNHKSFFKNKIFGTISNLSNAILPIFGHLKCSCVYPRRTFVQFLLYDLDLAFWVKIKRDFSNDSYQIEIEHDLIFNSIGAFQRSKDE